MIQYCAEGERGKLVEKASLVVKEALGDEDTDVRFEAVKMIQYCAEGERERLRQILSNQDIKTVHS